MKTQLEVQPKFKSAPIKAETAQKLRDIHALTGVQLYRIIQNLVEAEWKRLTATPQQEVSEHVA